MFRMLEYTCHGSFVFFVYIFMQCKHLLVFCMAGEGALNIYRLFMLIVCTNTQVMYTRTYSSQNTTKYLQNTKTSRRLEKPPRKHVRPCLSS
ncbi:hypothetical protein BKA81DRAFT_45948 [Phyllosticta paracitricarpa]